MRKFLIKFLGFVLCVAIVAGGAYLSYINTDFDALASDFEKAVSAGLPLFGGESEPEDGEEQNPPVENGGENNPPVENGGEDNPPVENGGEDNPPVEGGTTPEDSGANE